MEVNILKKLRSACDLVVDQNMEASQIAISVQTKLESKIHELKKPNSIQCSNC